MKTTNHKRTLLIAAISAGALAGGILGFGYSIYRKYLPPLQKPARGQPAAYGLLLGCPNHDDGSLSTSQIKRCQAAMEAWKQGRFSTLVISGSAVKNQYVEAEEMAEYIRQHEDIPILLETEARNTWENFVNSSAIIKDNPVVIITSSLHARRSAAIAKQFFRDVDVFTYPDRKLKHILREIASRWIYVRMEICKTKKS